MISVAISGFNESFEIHRQIYRHDYNDHAPLKDMPLSSEPTETCDIQQWMDILEALGYKWGYHIIKDLDGKSLRFNEIKNQINGLSSSALSERLTGLEEGGLVDRTVVDTSPPAVSYSLTERGVLMGKMLNELESTWEQTE